MACSVTFHGSRSVLESESTPSFYPGLGLPHRCCVLSDAHVDTTAIRLCSSLPIDLRDTELPRTLDLASGFSFVARTS